MVDITSNISSLRQQIPQSVKLIAVSKTKSVDDIMLAYNAGQRCFGENRVQELLRKKDMLPGDIEWHLIGHLQSNKVKHVVPFISMIESVDSFKLLKVIDSESSVIHRIVNCLFQIHIALEDTKFGFSMPEIHDMLHSEEFTKINTVRICGVMGMATFTDDHVRIRKEFRYLSGCFNELKDRYFSDNKSFREISMGMSGDYKIAVSEGSTIVRIGNLIFGERNQVR